MSACRHLVTHIWMNYFEYANTILSEAIYDKPTLGQACDIAIVKL